MLAGRPGRYAFPGAAARWRGMEHRHQVFGWHWLCAPGLMTLSAPEMVWVIEYYLTNPGERVKIGTEAELEAVTATLARVKAKAAR